MPKIPSKVSVIISLIFSVAFIAALLVAAVVMPSFVNEPGPTREFIEILVSDKIGVETGVTLFLIWGYCVIALALSSCVAVTLLLLRVRKGLVFTAKSVSYIRFVSWCCFILAAIIAVLFYFHKVAVIFALAAAFLGLCLRVVKNVIETATEIKNENDLTV